MVEGLNLTEGIRPIPGGPFSALTPSMWPQDILAKLGQPEVSVIVLNAKVITFTFYNNFSSSVLVQMINLTIVLMSLDFVLKKKMVPNRIQVNYLEFNLLKSHNIVFNGLPI